MRHGLQETSALAPALRPWWVERPRDGYVLRAVTLVKFATLPDITLEETSHYRITRGILDAPERYWKHLRGDASS